MTIVNTLKSMEIPNIGDIIKSSRNAKSKMANMKINKVNVHFIYSDGRFKQTVEGTMLHISEIPFVLISEPAKLGFLILEDTLIYDVTTESFEIFVNENYTHAISLSVLSNVDMHKKVNAMFENHQFLSPISVTQLRKFNISICDETEDIKLLPTFLSSLGRAKLLENTTETNNDGLIIVGIIGLLMGLVIGGIGTVIFVL